MKNSNNDDANLSIAEQPTGEFPALVESDGESGDTASLRMPRAVLNGTRESVTAAFGLTHLEAEIARLHAQWQSIDAEFKAREARIAELQAEIETREAAAAGLKADLRREAAALDAAERRLTDRADEIEALEQDRHARDERIAALAGELADAEVAQKATLEKIEQAHAEIATLTISVRTERATAAVAAERNEALVGEQRRLQTEIQDLKIYINGRHDRWSALNSELSELRGAVRGLQATVEQRDAAIAQHDEERSQLAAQILDLERRSAELADRATEREKAVTELETKLAARTAELEQIRMESTNGTRELDEARTRAVDRQQRIEDLEQEVAERSQRVQAIREDLRMSHEQLHVAQRQLADRTGQLASSQEALDQKSRQFEHLTAAFAVAEQETGRLRGDIERLETQSAALERGRSAAVAEAEGLKADLAAQREVIARLESQIREKRVIADLLERSVDRISELGTSLATLDREMNGSAGAPATQGPWLQAADFVSSVAVDEKHPEAARGGSEQPELLPVDLLLDGGGDDDEGVDIGSRAQDADRTGGESARKLVITIGGEQFTYPIVRGVMTIGRGHGSDIRIGSQFVSRLHAKIRTSGIATIIEDAGSKNGLLVNDERVTRRILRHGDVVSLGGDLTLRFIDAMH